MYSDDLGNHIVDVDDAIVKRCVEPKDHGTLALGYIHRFTIASSTSTIWFPRSLPYMANHVVFKVNYTVQGQPPGSRLTTD